MQPLKRHEYGIAKMKLAANEIEDLTETEGVSISWNQGGCEGMTCEVEPTLEKAIERAKRILEFYFSGQNYAEREDYPQIIKEFTFKTPDGIKHWRHDTLFYCYQWG